jgi:hypothetical protein
MHAPLCLALLHVMLDKLIVHFEPPFCHLGGSDLKKYILYRTEYEVPSIVPSMYQVPNTK